MSGFQAADAHRTRREETRIALLSVPSLAPRGQSGGAGQLVVLADLAPGAGAARPVPQELEKTSPLAKQAPSAIRSDLVAFEKEAAIASTASFMTQTPPDIMRVNAEAAELAVKVTLTGQGDVYRLELQGERGGGAGGNLQRMELQRILQMVEEEAGKGQWLNGVVAASATVDAPAPAQKPVRH